MEEKRYQPEFDLPGLDPFQDFARPRSSTDYEAVKERARRKAAELSMTGRDIGPIPPVAEPERKERCRRDLGLFLKTYFPAVFALPWSPIHLELIARLQDAAMHGGQRAVALPRGFGKTEICKHTAVWATVYGYRRFVLVIAAEGNSSGDLLEAIRMVFEANETFQADFPEICHAVTALEGITNRTHGQLCCGNRTYIEWGQRKIVYPSVPGAIAPGSVISCTTLTGRLRGLSAKLPSGETIRPDFVIIDDPQSRESAKSLQQVSDRLKLINSDILGMAGPQTKMTAVMPCTVIYPGDVADQMLDREKYPEWQGIRTGLLQGFPTHLELWQRYWEIRSRGLREETGAEESNRFYVANRAQMDAGCKASWPEYFRADEVSAVQYAMDIYLADKQRFYSEYQNEPQASDPGDGLRITEEEVWQHLSGRPRLEIPAEVTRLTMAVDVQQTVLFYMILGTSQDFTGWVVDYGVFPDQPRQVFKASEASPTYGDIYPGGGEAALFGALQDFVLPMVRSAYPREDGVELRISRCLIDSGWATQQIYDFVRNAREVCLLPSKGLGITATSQPISERKRRVGEVVSGYEWRIGATKGSVTQRVLFYDANWWKTFVRNRLRTSLGEPGTLRFCGREIDDRARLLANHLSGEYAIMDIALRRSEVWKLAPGRENHWLDTLVGCMVAASEQGAALLINPADASGKEALPRKYQPGKASYRSPDGSRPRSLTGHRSLGPARRLGG